MIYRVLSERYGWTPADIGQLTDAQIMMYMEAEHGQRADDWSRFGLRLDGDTIKGPIGALRRYAAYRQESA